MKLTYRFVSLFGFVLLYTTGAVAADWPSISPEELSMTSIKEQPGAPAVILVREEIDDDMNNSHSVYERIKILTDAGREYANVEIPYSRRHLTITNVSGRTVQPNGSIVPFQGQVFDKPMLKGKEMRVNVKSFTLPDAQAGSIIEYRYALRYDDKRLWPPEWYVQTDLFQRKAYFKYIPYQNHDEMIIVLDHGQISHGVAWLSLLGEGATPKLHEMPRQAYSTVHDIGQWIDLTRENIPALAKEPFMPPVSLLQMRVYFYYQQNLKTEEYWRAEGKYWSKDVESFIGEDKGVAGALANIVAPADSPEQKVRKIYAFVSSLENQSYIPERTSQEQKVLELKPNTGAEEVLEHRGGTHDQLNRLFVSMVRAAGIPASLIWVPDRSEEVFIPQHMSTRQFDAEVAIVQLDGKDVFLDPGTKFCPYGILDWRYTAVDGLREDPGKGTQFTKTPNPQYSQALRTRRADVSLDERGSLSGTVALVYKGMAAMEKRQEGGKTDAEGRKKMLEDELRELLPGNSEVSIFNDPDWDDTEKPLIAQFRVKCPFATAAGKRLMLSQHLFQVNEKPRFPSATRAQAVYFPYPWTEADEVAIQLPSGMSVESLAPDDSFKLKFAFYQSQHKQQAPDKIFLHRDFIMGTHFLPVENYQEVKGFFDKVKADDAQPTIVRSASSVAAN